MIPDLLDAVTRPAAYPRFAEENSSRAASYVAFLSIIFLAALGVSVKLRLAPLFAQTFSWLEMNMPVVQFAGGVVKSDPPGPLRLAHPRAKDLALMIDTNRQLPVSAAQMSEANVRAYLTAKALYLDRGQGRIESLDLTKASAERPVTVDASAYRSLARTFNWIFYPCLFLAAFLIFALSITVSGSIYALLGLLLGSVIAAPLGFGRLLRIAIHAQTAGCLLYALDMVSPFAIPLLPLISGALSLTFFWLGARASAAAIPAT